MFWEVSSFPRCEHHVFLSHCAEDRPWLVDPVYQQLTARGIIPWLDRHDYPYGRDTRSALRDGLLRSRHVVFFVTSGMMDYRRGWCPMELTYSEVIQSNLMRPGGSLLNFGLPLFFLDRSDQGLPRTVWNALRDRVKFHHPVDGPPAAWAADQIARFLLREQKFAADLSKDFAPSQPGYNDLARRIGLVERTTRFDPSPIA